MKQILRGKAARDALLAGMQQVFESVAATLGPQGRNAVIHIGWGQTPLSTRDGVTVAKAIDLPDPIHDAGAQMLKSVAAKTAEVSGDGTTTATVLAYHLCRAGLEAVDAGANPVALRREILAAADSVGGLLSAMARPVSPERISQVAAISANNDNTLGDLISRAIRQAGSHGIITVEDSPTLQTSLESAQGMRVASGWKSPVFISDASKQEYRAEDCQVIIFEKKLGSLKSGIQGLFQYAVEIGRPLLILAEDIEGDVMALLAVNRTQRLVPWCAVRMPPGSAPENYADIAAVVGAKVINDELGLPDDRAPVHCLGTAKSVRVSKYATTVVGYERTAAVSARIAAIRTQLEETNDPIERDRFQERLARLAGGISILRVGAATEVELKEKKARIEDAIHATKAAISEGILPGGGLALCRAIENFEAENAGAEIVRLACLRPLQQIADNAGRACEIILDSIEHSNPAFGWNALTDKVEDLLVAGVIDPLKVTRTALLNAASLAAMVLVTECLIVDVDEPQSFLQARPA